MSPPVYHHSKMVTPALGTQDVRFQVYLMHKMRVTPDCCKIILLSFRLGASSIHQKDIGSYIKLFFICRRLERLIGLAGGLI